jgi:ParB-like chromosome segregation protein Spo0J
MNLNIKRVKINSLKMDPANSRKHDKKNLDAIKGSIAKFGQVEPLIVQKSTGAIIGGNGRLMALKELNYEEVDIVEIDLDNTQSTALSIALNRASELASWDISILGQHLEALAEDGMDLVELGFDANDMLKFEIPESANGKEFDESIADSVEYLECPECGHKWPK